jgi:hypothetical protein
VGDGDSVGGDVGAIVGCASIRLFVSILPVAVGLLPSFVAFILFSIVKPFWILLSVDFCSIGTSTFL